METTRNLLRYFTLYFLPIILVQLLQALVVPMPSFIDWLYRCPTGDDQCANALNLLNLVIAYILFAFLVGIVLELVKKANSIRIRTLRRLNTWIRTPRIIHRFALPGHNDLRLYIKTQKRTKDVFVECWFKDYMDGDGKKYLQEHHNGLRLVENSYGVGAHPPFFEGTLASNDEQEIRVGIPYSEKIALYTGDAHVFGFQDGVYEYVIGCTAKCQNMNFDLPDFKIWLTIVNGALVEIKDKQ